MINPNKFSNDDWSTPLVEIYHNHQLEKYFLVINDDSEDFDTFKEAVLRLKELLPGIIGQLF
jgi:hypothetical protein